MAEQPEMDEKYFDELVEAQKRAEKAAAEKKRTIGGWIAETFDRTLKQSSPEAMVEELYWSTLAMPLDFLNWMLDHLPEGKEDKAPAAGSPAPAQPDAAAPNAPVQVGQPAGPVVVGQPGAPVVFSQTAGQRAMTLDDVKNYVGLYLRLNDLIAEQLPPAEYTKLEKQTLAGGRKAVVVDKKTKAAVKPYLRSICADDQVRAYTRAVAGKDLAEEAMRGFVMQQASGKGLDTAARSQPVLAAPDRKAVEQELKRAGNVRQRAVEMFRDNQALKRARQNQAGGRPDPNTRSNEGGR
ncbi:MAG: hypothetical protein PHX68_01830 [Alphaproteobacteria bacterium]|nr:hypothetical protein [Alphaproteobacteria bacterium]